MMKLLGIACVFALLASCSSGPEVDILGQWKEIGGMETWEFFKDGTVRIKAEGIFDVRAKYTFVGNGRIKLERDGASDLVKVSVSAGQLTLTFEDGQVSNYKKVR